MEDDTTEEPIEECKETKQNFAGYDYVDRDVESMAEESKENNKKRAI
jgi:hypothetical protein